MKQNNNRRARIGILLTSAALLILALISTEFLDRDAKSSNQSPQPPSTTSKTASHSQPGSSSETFPFTSFARQHGLQISDWPEELLELLERNPETEEFVLHYPLKKDRSFLIDLSEYQNCRQVPLLLQWDERWGYTRYGDNLMGLTGCGPTCLSMVCIYLLGRTDLSPRAVADFAESRGYYAPGKGTTWTLFSEGGAELGLNIHEIPLVKNRMIAELSNGNPIICALGPGDFTSAGHFVVLTGYTDGKFKLNDPNSPNRSARLWDYSELEHQIRNLWVCQA